MQPLAHGPAQAHAIGHMAWAEMPHQRFPRFMLQLFQVGGTDVQILIPCGSYQPSGLIADQLKHNVLHAAPSLSWDESGRNQGPWVVLQTTGNRSPRSCNSRPETEGKTTNQAGSTVKLPKEAV